MPNVEGSNEQTGEGNENETITQNQQISRVTAKLPPLWKNKIKIWFIQVECNFQLAGIVCDLTKYNHVVSAIDTDTLSAVSDILLSPPNEGKYEALKQRLIQEFSHSETQKIRQLVSELQLGDDKPSHLLRKMRELAGTAFSDDFLKTLWLQRLPSEMQTILSISTENVDNVAKMADKIAEVRNENASHAVLAINQQTRSPFEDFQNQQTFSNKNISGGEVSALRLEIAELTKQVQRLSHPNYRNYRGRSFNRTNRNYRPRSQSRERQNFEGKCYYHFKFGNKAFRCTPPCNSHSSEQQNSAIQEN